MVYPGTSCGTLFHLGLGDSGAFLCIPMKIGVKSEHYKSPSVYERQPCNERAQGQFGPVSRVPSTCQANGE
jgi:hypothetical protein